MIKEFIDNLLNPQVRAQKKLDLKQECQVKFDKSIYLKDYLKSRMWLEFNRPIVYRSLELGIGSLLRNGLTMNELEIKSIIADIRANLNQVEEMKFAISAGEKAAHKLEEMR